MGFKVKFEAELDGRLKEEVDFWGFSVEEVVKEAMEHGMWGALRRKTDNLCRSCRRPIRSSVPPEDRRGEKHPGGFCECG